MNIKRFVIRDMNNEVLGWFEHFDLANEIRNEYYPNARIVYESIL